MAGEEASAAFPRGGKFSDRAESFDGQRFAFLASVRFGYLGLRRG
jgi:hypothetical protein